MGRCADGNNHVSHALHSEAKWGSCLKLLRSVTTGEKWDSLTRNWEDHEQILAQIQLFLVDEVA